MTQTPWQDLVPMDPMLVLRYSCEERPNNFWTDDSTSSFCTGPTNFVARPEYNAGTCVCMQKDYGETLKLSMIITPTNNLDDLCQEICSNLQRDCYSHLRQGLFSNRSEWICTQLYHIIAFLLHVFNFQVYGEIKYFHFLTKYPWCKVV